MSLKQLILEVEAEFPNYRNVELRRTYNKVILKGGNKFDQMRTLLNAMHYMDTIPKGVKFYQIQLSTRVSHFFSQSPNYWKEMRPGGVVRSAITRRPLHMLKLHYKTVTYEDNDEHDANMATQLMMAAKLVYEPQSLKLKCVIQCIKYLIKGNDYDMDGCKEANPDIVLQKFLCRIGFDGWIRLHNVQTLTQDFKETKQHTIDEIMVCDLDNMEFDYE